MQCMLTWWATKIWRTAPAAASSCCRTWASMWRMRSARRTASHWLRCRACTTCQAQCWQEAQLTACRSESQKKGAVYISKYWSDCDFWAAVQRHQAAGKRAHCCEQVLWMDACTGAYLGLLPCLLAPRLEQLNLAALALMAAAAHLHPVVLMQCRAHCCVAAATSAQDGRCYAAGLRSKVCLLRAGSLLASRQR